MGQIALAKKLIKRALCLLHKGFPHTWLGAFFQSLLEESKHSAYHTQQHQAQHTEYAQCIRVLEWLWELATREESIIVLACFYSACLDLLLCDAGFDYRPIEECLQFINQYEASYILKSQSNILLSLYSSLALWFGRLQQWDLFEDNFTKAQRLVSRTNTSLFGTHGFFRFLECQGLLLQRVMEDMPEKVRETRSSTLGYFEEFLSRCSTSPVYHTRVYSLKASVNLLGDEDKSQAPLWRGLKLSATSHNRLEEMSLSVRSDRVQNKNQGSGRVEELKDSKDQDEEGTREYMKSVTSRLKSEPRLEELTFVHLQLGQAPASPHTLPSGEPMEYISTAPRTLPSTSRKPQGDGDKV
ncbi:hypothetical protein KIL84_007217 [Mauremys mutica]|uniref:Uncharacterized protein n=1 Tax=Mauremys mutica TaxID=74926 RepID=A0A9D4AVC9_9SAUR|nr:hypothetical protein KIL84_007217 [Mauremys mutica]